MTEPETTPECTQLMEIVDEAIRTIHKQVFPNERMKENAEGALDRLRKKRCTKAIAYIANVSSRIPGDFARRIHSKAVKYLSELS